MAVKKGKAAQKKKPPARKAASKPLPTACSNSVKAEVRYLRS